MILYILTTNDYIKIYKKLPNLLSSFNTINCIRLNLDNPNIKNIKGVLSILETDYLWWDRNIHDVNFILDYYK